MKPFTFDQIPVMMNKIHDKLEHLEKLIIRISNVEENKEEVREPIVPENSEEIQDNTEFVKN